MKKPFVILLAEDNEHDIIARKRAWKKLNIVNPLFIANNGDECLDYLYQRANFSKPDSATKHVILLLDIKMPKIVGITVLKNIRADSNLAHLPVIMLTTSDEEQDRLQSYEPGANAYIKKPIGFGNFSEAIHRIHLFWEPVELPEVNHDS